ncbi:hypothetical protein [Chitinasiproducens palmae]|nr:hypothetical protein [Chitinasiproducens palmae]
MKISAPSLAGASSPSITGDDARPGSVGAAVSDHAGLLLERLRHTFSPHRVLFDPIAWRKSVERDRFPTLVQGSVHHASRADQATGA